MDHAEYVRMAAASDGHWWYRSTRRLLADILDPFLPPPADDRRYHVLDAAGGTGATSRWLTERARVTIADIETQALEVARGLPEASVGGGLDVVRADLNHLPFADACLDGVLCVTALCHRMNPDPAALVAGFARIVRPGGFVLLMEPGGRRLRRGHDDVTHTGRRFARADLVDMLQGAGLTVRRATGAYSFLVPPAWLLGKFEKGDARSDVGRHATGLRGVLGGAAAAERALLRHANLPVGLSVIAVGVRE